MKIAWCVALAAALVSVGCGGKERTEAVGLAKALKSRQADFDKANATEKDLIRTAREWVTGMTEKGTGSGDKLDEHAATASALAKSAVEASTAIGLVRQAVYDMPLNEEFTSGVRNKLITEITRRQRALQDLRSTLEPIVPELQANRKKKDFKGDSYPAGVVKLQSVLQTYKTPLDAVADALLELKTKYSLTPAEM
jgi:hypothetical protein